VSNAKPKARKFALQKLPAAPHRVPNYDSIDRFFKAFNNKGYQGPTIYVNEGFFPKTQAAALSRLQE